MVVEAMFWFHPLVWWLGGRLVEERERACDEEVLEFGSERQIYAESILKVCEFCVGSPLACVSGVTGADLKERIVQLMTKNVVRKLDFSRKLMLSLAGLIAVAVPVGFGVLHATPSRAEAVAASGANPYNYRVTKFVPSKSSSKGKS
jgi:bla regulator protein BlaR1